MVEQFQNISTSYVCWPLIICVIAIVRAEEITLGVTASWKGFPWGSALLGIMPALKKVNDDPTILANDTLTFLWVDTMCKVEHVSDAISLMSAPVDVLIGSPCSDECKILAPQAQHLNIPMVSYYAASQDFSDKAKYPNFVRVGTNVNVFTQATLGLMQHLNFSSVVSVYDSSSDFDIEADGVMRDLFSLHDISVALVLPIIKGVGFTDALAKQIHLLGARVVYSVGFACPLRRQILLALSSLGSLAGYTFVFGGNLDTCWQEGERQTDSLKSFAGVLVINAYFAMNGDIMKEIHAASNDFEPYASKPFSGTSSRTSTSRLNPQTISSYSMETIGSASFFSACVYDAILLYAYAAHTVRSSAGNLKDIPTMHAALTSVRFDGATGEVALDTKGDRLTGAYCANLQYNENGDGLVMTSVMVFVQDGSSTYGNYMWLLPTSSYTWPGNSTNKPADHVTVCLSGYYSEAGSCLPCPEGQYSEGIGFDRQSCMSCVAGKAQADIAQSQCNDCSTGFSAASGGMTSCKRCILGTYSKIEGSTACTVCLDALQTTAYHGASEETDCVCKAGFYFRPGSGCVQCGEGLKCFMSNGPPFQDVGYNVQVINQEMREYEVYQCPMPAVCPRGLLGECSGGGSGIMCLQCAKREYMDEDRGCLKCHSGHYAALLALIVTPIVCLPFVLMWLAWRSQDDSVEFVHVLALLGQVPQFLQLLSVLSTLDLPWSNPWKAVIESKRFASLEFDFIRYSCIGEGMFIYVLSYGFKIVIPLAFTVVVAMWFSVVKFGLRLPVTTSSLFSWIGNMISMIYISLTKLAFTPFKCVLHPCGKETVRAAPLIPCNYANTEHVAMVIFASCGIVIYLVSYLSVLYWATWTYPRMVNKRNEGFLSCFKFLFINWHPDYYWAGTSRMTRNLLYAMLPMVIPQMYLNIILLVMQALLFATFTLIVRLHPWRFHSLNVMDMVFHAAVLYFIQVGSLALPAYAMSESEGWFICIVYVLLGVAVVGCSVQVILSAISKRKRNLQKFKEKTEAYQHELESYSTNLAQLRTAMAQAGLQRQDQVISEFNQMNSSLQKLKDEIDGYHVPELGAGHHQAHEKVLRLTAECNELSETLSDAIKEAGSIRRKVTDIEDCCARADEELSAGKLLKHFPQKCCNLEEEGCFPILKRLSAISVSDILKCCPLDQQRRIVKNIFECMDVLLVNGLERWNREELALPEDLEETTRNYNRTYKTAFETSRDTNRGEYNHFCQFAKELRNDSNELKGSLNMPKVHELNDRVTTILDYYNEAARLSERFKTLLYEVAQEVCPGKAIDRVARTAQLKSFQRVVEKMVLRPNEPIPKDIARGQLQLQDFGELKRAMQVIKGKTGVKIYDVKNKFEFADGWADLTLIILFESEERFEFGAVLHEVQVVHNNLMAVREGFAPPPHEVYENSRLAAEMMRLRDNIPNSALPYGRISQTYEEREEALRMIRHYVFQMGRTNTSVSDFHFRRLRSDQDDQSDQDDDDDDDQYRSSSSSELSI